jgi:hypothetical protein
MFLSSQYTLSWGILSSSQYILSSIPGWADVSFFPVHPKLGHSVFFPVHPPSLDVPGITTSLWLELLLVPSKYYTLGCFFARSVADSQSSCSVHPPLPCGFGSSSCHALPASSLARLRIQYSSPLLEEVLLVPTVLFYILDSSWCSLYHVVSSRSQYILNVACFFRQPSVV